MTSRRTFLQTAAASPLLGYTIAAPCAPQQQRRPSNGTPMPNVELVTHQNVKVRFYDDLVRGRFVTFNMMYANCTNVCPPSTANLLQVQQTLGPRVGQEVFMYSLTLQPDLDSPGALRDYMRRYGVREGWTFLTGSRKNVDIVRRALGFFDPDPAVDADLRQHTGMLRIGHDARDRWSMIPAQATTRQILNSISNYF